MYRTKGDYGFEAKDQNGIIINTDNSQEGGGGNHGFRPMQLLLAALGSCSAIDVVSILKKQRQIIHHFKIIVEAEREADKIPALWKSAHVTFELEGEILSDRAMKACQLSIEKYCSVAETLRRSGTEITWNLLVNNTPVNHIENKINERTI